MLDDERLNALFHRFFSWPKEKRSENPSREFLERLLLLLAVTVAGRRGTNL